MIYSGMSNVAILFTAAVLGLFFVVIWIIKSEMTLTACRREIRRLRSMLDKDEREKFAIAEKLSAIEMASGGSVSEDVLKRCEELEIENAAVRKELADAKGSLEEVYKAIVSQ